jgi:nuclease S1
MRLLLLAAILFAQPVLAWGEFGHRLVGELAERQLSPAARAEVAALLADEPEPTLAGVSAWADRVREARLEDYEHTRSWHYVNFPSLDCEYVPARDCPDGNCVIGAITSQERLLGDRSQPGRLRREALKFLVHFVGDVHQPLHAGLASDRGGTRFQVNVDGQGTNLHGVWDAVILRGGPKGVSAYVAHLERGLVQVDTATVAAPVPAAGWALESCQLLRDGGIYPERRRIGTDYLDRFRPLAERRLQQAARRLAELIERALVP